MTGCRFLLIFLATTIAVIDARGPLCLNCLSVSSPEDCRTVKECQNLQNCYSEHFLYENGTDAFSFGCRSSHLFENQRNVQKRFDMILCQYICTGDLCNNNVCTNGTEPPPGVPCLSCTGIHDPRNCSHLTYCGQGEVCYTEASSSGRDPAYNMGCIRHQMCSFFPAEIIGRRSVRFITGIQHLCHKCCDSKVCNFGACVQEQTTISSSPATVTTKAPLPHARDCWELRSMYNKTTDGIYSVLAQDGRAVDVYCDMTTDGGGWTVFQKRFNGEVLFNQSFVQYQRGFGSLSREFWMGNDLLHEFTKNQDQKLRIDLCDWEGAGRKAEYESFSLANSSDEYRLSVANYSGDAGDALLTGIAKDENHNNRPFSTFDRDNDIWNGNCAAYYHSGWWFGFCFSANLNGAYQTSDAAPAWEGILWIPWHGKYSLKGTELKFRPATANPSSHEAFSCPVQ